MNMKKTSKDEHNFDNLIIEEDMEFGILS